MRQLLQKILKFGAVPTDNPELLKAQYGAFIRQMPMMYFILLTSSWAVAITHMVVAPPILTVLMPSILTAICIARVVGWWKSRGTIPSPEQAARALRRVNYLAFAIAIAFAGWSFLLFPYGDAYTRSHLAFYMAITVISCIFSLMHLRSAALIVAVIVNGAFVAFFASTGQPTFIAIAVNFGLVSIGMLVILTINYRDFARMVNAQTDTRRREEEQSRLLRMIDDMPIAIMTIELSTFIIDYANDSAKSLMRSIEHILPIKADALVGTRIDVLHEDPQYQRQILANPDNLPHNARIHAGSEVLDLKVSAVTADDGSYLGPMLSLALVTKEVEAETRILPD